MSKPRSDPRSPGDERKFRELILYISQNCANDPSFGAVKLNKILFFADFAHFAHYGKPLTGIEYRKLNQGPVPRRLIPIRESMIANRELAVQEMPIVGSLVQQCPVNLRQPNLDLFTAKEIALVDAVIKALDGLTAKKTSDLSHGMQAWKLAEDGQTIPYGAVFLGNSKPTERDIARGLEIAKEHGLLVAAE